MPPMIFRRCFLLALAAAPLCQHIVGAQTAPPDTTKRPTTLPSVQVTATPTATDARRIAQPTIALDGATLRRAQSASLGETLEHLPGVRSLSMTTGIGKPVIRGLTNNRVVTLANGQRTETQQWGHDHSPNVESADAERIEVVKGPASVLHGSDALGGVVNVIRRPLPRGNDGEFVLRGRLALAYASAAEAPSASLTGEGAKGALGWRITGTGRRAADLRTPAARVGNTGNQTGAGDLTLGWAAPRQQVTLNASARRERIEIAEDPVTDPSYTGWQRITTSRLSIDGSDPSATSSIRWQLGWEQNVRAEYGAANAMLVDLGLRSTTLTGTVQRAVQFPSRIVGTVGVATQQTTFRTFGRETLIPDNRARAIGVFAFAQRTAGPLSLSAGARHDWRTLTTPGSAALRLAAASRDFQAFTGTTGVVWHADRPIAVAANVSRGFRAPSASDLFANGFHEGTRAFERGRADLRVEQALNTDLGLRVRTSRVNGEVNAFVNRIDDYIYLAPVGASGRALDSLEVAQGNARLTGAEFSSRVQLGGAFSAQLTADVVRAINRADGSALPFVPPGRALVSLRWDERAPGRYASITSEWNAKQRRTFRADYAPPAWNVWSVNAGRSLITARGVVSVDLSVRNLLNTRYRDFMSRYKEFADAPGRSLVLRLSADL